MLLRLLHSRPGSAKWIEGRTDRLRKEVEFLLAVIGDESFDSSDLLAEFEAVANKAGSLVHLIFFSNKLVREKRFGPLLRHVESLKAKIEVKREQCIIAETADIIQKKGAAVSSLFIIDSILVSLEDLLSKEGIVIADLVDQVRTLQLKLKRSSSYTKTSPLSQSNEYAMRMRDAAYEAEYLLNSFLVGDLSCRYFRSIISHVIHKIKLVETEVQGIYKNVETEVSEFARLSLKDKSSSSDAEDVVGFDEEELEVLQYLDGGEKLQIIAIYGIPGVGKTTLAKKLYHHSSLKDKFHYKKSRYQGRI